jgi:hypothetical protein
LYTHQDGGPIMAQSLSSSLELCLDTDIDSAEQ